MKIKINSKSHKIKPASEMTVKEYILLFDGIEKEISSLEILIKYISITLDIKYNHVADINIDENTLRRLFAYVGEILTIEDMPESLLFYHKKTGKTLYQSSLNWRTIGVRKLLEERKTENPMEQAVYLLAVYVSGDYDHENIEKIYDELQNYNAISVFSFVIFFFMKLLNGKGSGTNFLKMLRKKVSTNIAKLLNKSQAKG